MKGTNFKYIITFSTLLNNKEPKCLARRVLHDSLGLCEINSTCLSRILTNKQFQTTFYVYLFELFPEGICLGVLSK